MSTPPPPEPGPSGPGQPPGPGSPPVDGGQRVVRRSRSEGVIADVVCGVAIPAERPDQPSAPAPQGRRETGRLVLGGSLVVLGLVLLLDRLAPDLDELFWPVAVVAVGVAVMLVGLRR